MKFVEHFTPQEMAKFFRYDPETGELTSAVERRYKKIGDSCEFNISEGYRGVSLNGKQMPVHRVAWAIYYGEWPNGQIDHINRDRKDNRIANLRAVTPAQNRMNTKVQSPHGLLGVTQLPHGRWQAQSGIGGTMKYLGTFDTKELAHQAYMRYANAVYAGYLPQDQ